MGFNPRTWDGSIREFLLDAQRDPEMIERIMADEMKPPCSFHLSTTEKCVCRPRNALLQANRVSDKLSTGVINTSEPLFVSNKISETARIGAKKKTIPKSYCCERLLSQAECWA